MSLIIFLSITLIGPISEEILYRHLLIGEVGKILPYKVMAIISILLFAVIHILSAKSLLEILTYLVLAVPIVLSYLKSNFNVFVSISLHVFINITSYIYIYICSLLYSPNKSPPLQKKKTLPFSLIIS